MKARRDERPLLPSKLEHWPDFPKADKSLADQISDIRDPFHYIRDRPRPQIKYIRK